MTKLNSFTKQENVLRKYRKVLYLIPVLFGIVIGFGLSFSYAKVEQERTDNSDTTTITTVKEKGTLLSITDSDNSAFWNYSESITKVVFQNKLLLMETDLHWDVSVEKNGSVMSYLVANDESKTTYTLYIQGKGGVNANSDSSNLFANFTNLEVIEGLEYLDTSQVTNMSQMFYNCSRLTSLNLNSLDTSNVTSMNMMFANCTNLVELNVFTFDTSSVTDMQAMFYNCSNLGVLNLNNFNFDSVKAISTDAYGFFEGATNITTTINIKSNSITEYAKAFTNAATTSESQITINYVGETEELIDKMMNTKLPDDNIVKGSCVAHCSLKLYGIKFYDQDGKLTSSFMSYSDEKIKVPVATGYEVTAFELNGELINGNTFTMPQEDVEITDIQIIETSSVPSE